MTPAKKLLIAIIALVIFFIGIAVASDCGCDAEPSGGWESPPDLSDDDTVGGDTSFTDATDSGSSGTGGSSGSSTDIGGADTSSGGSSGSDSSSSDSGSSSSPSSSSAEEGVIWRMKGDDLFKKGLFNESLAAYEKATSYDPYAYRSWIGTGRVLLAMDNPGEAATAFRKAIRLDPANSEAALLLGDALAAAGSYEEAVTQYLKALALNPNLEGVKEKITLAETGAAVGNGSGKVTPEMTVEIPLTETLAEVTPNLTPETTTAATDVPATPKAPFPGVEGMLLALVMGSLLVVFRKR